MGRKTNVQVFLATNKRNITQEDVDMVKKMETFRKKLNLSK